MQRFRWVFCQLESLKKCLKPKDVEKALRSLPRTLDDTYARVLLSIEDTYHQEAITSLQWLALSSRPLTVEELAEASIINPQNDSPFDLKDRFTDPHNILKILSSLVVVSTRAEGVDQIKLAHFSVKEYLMSNREKPAGISEFTITANIANQTIAEGCILYIERYVNSVKHKHLNLKYCYQDIMGELERFPLLHYACIFWLEHPDAMHSTIDISIITSTSILFTTGFFLICSLCTLRL